MNFVTTSKHGTTDSADTQRLGVKIARLLKGREVIELVGDIGAGKTTLSQGIIHGLGYSGEVPSPTFTVSRSYPVRNGLTVHHFDFYRMQGHDITTTEFAEAITDPDGITLIEWPGSGEAQLPDRRLRITLTPTHNDGRTIRVESLGSTLDYVVKGLQHDIGA